MDFCVYPMEVWHDESDSRDAPSDQPVSPAGRLLGAGVAERKMKLSCRLTVAEKSPPEGEFCKEHIGSTGFWNQNWKNITKAATQSQPASIRNEVEWSLHLFTAQRKNSIGFHLYGPFIHNTQRAMKKAQNISRKRWVLSRQQKQTSGWSDL